MDLFWFWVVLMEFFWGGEGFRDVGKVYEEVWGGNENMGGMERDISYRVGFANGAGLMVQWYFFVFFSCLLR